MIGGGTVGDGPSTAPPSRETVLQTEFEECRLRVRCAGAKVTKITDTTKAFFPSVNGFHQRPAALSQCENRIRDVLNKVEDNIFMHKRKGRVASAKHKPPTSTI